MTGRANEAQGYFPRSSDFLNTLRTEARWWGVPAKPLITAFDELGVRSFLAAPKYQYRLRKVAKDRENWDKNFPHGMSHSPLAYAFLVNAEATVEAMQDWFDYVYTNNEPLVTFHESVFIHSSTESVRYAAHLDTAVLFGAVEGRDLGAVTSPHADGAMMPLSAYTSHLRLKESQLVDLASIYYRWNAEYVSTHRLPSGIHGYIGTRFAHAMSHDGYASHYDRWAGYVPEGTEMAWALIDFRHRRNIERQEWFDNIESVIASGASADHFDAVASTGMPIEVVIEIVKNGVDTDLLESLKGM